MSLPYNLKSDDGTAYSYYQAVDNSVEDIFDYIDKNDNGLTYAYINSIESTVSNGKLSRGEYQLDILITGVLWSAYIDIVKMSPGWTLPVLEILWQIRSRLSLLKPVADFLRGIIFRFFLPLKKAKCCHTIQLSIPDFDKFIKWLRATGEFREEAKRVACCKQFLKTLSKDTQQEYIGKIQDISKFFTEYMEKFFSGYTKNIPEYSQKVFDTLSIREDLILRTKPARVYHLNMFGAEVMNIGLFPAFRTTEKKVVLLPGCMRIDNGIKCKAKQTGKDLICSECNLICPVAKVARTGRYSGFRTVIILHFENFYETIQRWASEKTTGIIASACLLNLLQGGYELHKRGIKSQCIPLNLSGCRNHWSTDGTPTDFDLSRLHRILQKTLTKDDGSNSTLFN